MGTNGSESRSALSLETIVAFNDELTALVRARVPLERGLLAASADYRGRLGLMLRDVAGHLEGGEPLADALARAARGMPAVYPAIIEAGTRSGRLAEALQGLARLGQAHLEARRTIALALFYPLLVLALAYGLILFFVADLFPRFFAAVATFRIAESPVYAGIERAGNSVAIWGPILPLTLVGLFLLWRVAGRSRSLDGSGWNELLGDRLPLVGRIMVNFRAANFADMLGHLVEHDVPLDQAIRLAAAATGSPQLCRDAEQFADRLARGDRGSPGPASSPGGFPPLVAWMLASTTRQATLGAGLRHLATAYRRKARRQAETLRVFLPGFLILTLGAGAVLAYGLLLFVPLHTLWNGLATP